MLFLTISFRPLPLPKSWLNANRLQQQIFHSTISLPDKKFLFLKISDDVIACELWFGAPPIKNPGYAYACTIHLSYQYKLAEVESRTQGSRPRPRTQKIRGQGQGQPFRGQTLSRPRTGMLEAKAKDQGHKRTCSPKKKRSSKNFFKQSPQKNVFQKIFQALHKILTIQKIVLSSSRGQANFRGLEASRPRPRTSKCVLEDVLEAKDVLEDSTSAN